MIGRAAESEEKSGQAETGGRPGTVFTLCHLIRPAQDAVGLLLDDVERCNSGMRRIPIVDVLEI